MSERNCLILTQYRNGSDYNDFLGKFYHFSALRNTNYLNRLRKLPIEFVFYEPQKQPGGKGEFFGYGKISKLPFEDKREPGYYFVEIDEYKQFSTPVSYKNAVGEILEQIRNPKYNSGNSVREIPPDLLDEICLDGGIQLNFKADSHLVQVLGEQLIASERVGILELVKNAFDAGATYCNVLIEKIPNLEPIPESLYKYNQFEGPVIVIEDDGSGMTKEQIELGWLRPASVIKTNVKERIKKEREKATQENKLKTFNKFLEILKKENKGRIPLGEKGVGRFASHRLGRNLIIKTKVAENDYEYLLKIDWDNFNSANGAFKDLDSVPITLTRQLPTRDYGNKGSGTQLIIYGGREGFELTEEEVKEINRSILKLNSPNPKPKTALLTFNATFSCPQLKELDEKINYFTYDPVFTINGIVDENGMFEYDYSFSPPYNIPLPPFNFENEEFDLKTIKSKHWKDNDDRWRKPACGSFYFHLNVWYRDTPWVNRSDIFLKYLKENGGISIYRDGINVFPAEWGSEDDWLGLRQRQIQQAFHISYYHMIGNVEINQYANIDLIDKTNREGMIRNQAFVDLTELVRAIVYFVEKDYIGKRDEYRKLSGELIRNPRRVRAFSKQSANILSNIAERYDLTTDEYLLFENITELGDEAERKGKLVELSKSLENLESNLKQIQEVQDMLAEQAGFGLGISIALHEISKTTSHFYYGILEVIKNGKIDTTTLEDLKDTSRALESEIMRVSPLRALRNEQPIEFRVSRSIEYVRSVFRRRFENLNISFSYNHDQDFKIVARYGALNQILTNLLDNSCYWLDNPDLEDRKIEISIDAFNRSIIVADNGPDIAESILPYLFQPGYSLKYPPSGLGLYICKHYMNLMKKRGDIYLAREKDRIKQLKGAQFLLDFSKVKEDDDE